MTKSESGESGRPASTWSGPSSKPGYVSIKDICDELTAYGFSYKWGNTSNPIVQPWRLVEGKARKMGMLFEGERAIRRFWEDNVRSKLPDAFYKKKDLCSEAWVMEARRRCGFDGPDFKDRFASSKKKAVAPPDSSFSDMAVDEANGGMGSPVSHHYHQHHQQQAPSPPMSPDDPHPDDPPLKREEELSETALLIRRAHELLFGPSRLNKKKKKHRDSDGHKVKKKKRRQSSDEEEEEEEASPAGFPSSAAGGEGRRRSSSSREPLSEVPLAQEQTNGDKRREKRVAGTPWTETKAQSELFELLFAKAPCLTAMQLDMANTLLQKGDSKVIGLLKAYKDKDDSKAQAQFKRIIDTIVSDARVFSKHS